MDSEKAFERIYEGVGEVGAERWSHDVPPAMAGLYFVFRLPAFVRDGVEVMMSVPRMPLDVEVVEPAESSGREVARGIEASRGSQ